MYPCVYIHIQIFLYLYVYVFLFFFFWQGPNEILPSSVAVWIRAWRGRTTLGRFRPYVAHDVLDLLLVPRTFTNKNWRTHPNDNESSPSLCTLSSESARKLRRFAHVRHNHSQAWAASRSSGGLFARLLTWSLSRSAQTSSSIKSIHVYVYDDWEKQREKERERK